VASSRHIFYVDSDVVLTEGCLQTMMREMKANGYSGIHAQVLGVKDMGYWAWAEDQRFRMRFNRVGEAPYIVTMAAIFERDVILKYRFDPFFTVAAEDADLCYRLRKAHLRVGISSASVYHRHRATALTFIKQRIRYSKGNARFFWKHRSLISLLGPSAQLPFGIYVCIKQRSVKMLPYYLVWSAVGTYGLLTELSTLMVRKLVSNRPE
jgi:GT2 family glycosyltransferase